MRIRIVFVRTASPTGTPATITIFAPDSTRPAFTFTFSDFSNISSVEESASVHWDITPQFNQATFCLNVTNECAKMSAFGRFREIKRSMTCLSKSYNQFDIHWASSIFNTAEAITSVIVTRKWIWISRRPYSLRRLWAFVDCSAIVYWLERVFLACADSPEHCSVSSVDNSVEYVWFTSERCTFVFSHCFKHVCCSDNNFTCSIDFLDNHFLINWRTIERYFAIPITTSNLIIPSAASMISSKLSIPCWFSILANNWTCLFPVSSQITNFVHIFCIVYEFEIAMKLISCSRETDIVFIAFSKSWEKGFSVRDVHTFLCLAMIPFFKTSIKFTSCIIFWATTKRPSLPSSTKTWRPTLTSFEISRAPNVQRNHFTCFDLILFSCNTNFFTSVVWIFFSFTFEQFFTRISGPFIEKETNFFTCNFFRSSLTVDILTLCSWFSVCEKLNRNVSTSASINFAMFSCEFNISFFSPQYPSSPNFLPPRISTAGPKVANLYTRLFIFFDSPLYMTSFWSY